MHCFAGDYSTRYPHGKVFTEEDWTDTETAKDAYIKAKTLAEKAAWTFVAELPGKLNHKSTHPSLSRLLSSVLLLFM